MHEFVVPRSIPIVFATGFAPSSGTGRKSQSLYIRSSIRPVGSRHDPWSDQVRRDSNIVHIAERSRIRSFNSDSTGQPRPASGQTTWFGDVWAAPAAAMLPGRADQGSAGDDEDGAEGESPPHALGLPDEERREADAPERLGRDERRDDAHPPAPVGLEEADVGEPEEDARRREAAELAPRSARGASTRRRRACPRSASRRRRSPGSRARAARATMLSRVANSDRGRRRRRAARAPAGAPAGRARPRAAPRRRRSRAHRATSGELQRLVEEDERDRDRNERRGTDRDRRARRADLADREREEDLRAARREQPGEQERPRVVHVVADERSRERRRRAQG